MVAVHQSHEKVADYHSAMGQRIVTATMIIIAIIVALSSSNSLSRSSPVMVLTTKAMRKAVLRRVLSCGLRHEAQNGSGQDLETVLARWSHCVHYTHQRVVTWGIIGELLQDLLRGIEGDTRVWTTAQMDADNMCHAQVRSRLRRRQDSLKQCLSQTSARDAMRVRRS